MHLDMGPAARKLVSLTIATLTVALASTALHGFADQGKIENHDYMLCVVSSSGLSCPQKSNPAHCPTPYNLGDYYCSVDNDPEVCLGPHITKGCAEIVVPKSPTSIGGCGVKVHCNNDTFVRDIFGDIVDCGQRRDACYTYNVGP